jgi:hypothetical protein
MSTKNFSGQYISLAGGLWNFSDRWDLLALLSTELSLSLHMRFQNPMHGQKAALQIS